MDATKITCKRCKGTGITNNAPVFAGIPGGCYKCATRGWVYKDKFSAAFIEGKGDFYGFTTTYRHGLFITKNIARCTEEEAKFGCDRQTTYTKITEEQARKFFERYGVSTYVYPEKAAA